MLLASADLILSLFALLLNLSSCAQSGDGREILEILKCLFLYGTLEKGYSPLVFLWAASMGPYLLYGSLTLIHAPEDGTGIK